MRFQSINQLLIQATKVHRTQKNNLKKMKQVQYK